MRCFHLRCYNPVCKCTCKGRQSLFKSHEKSLMRLRRYLAKLFLNYWKNIIYWKYSHWVTFSNAKLLTLTVNCYLGIFLLEWSLHNLLGKRTWKNQRLGGKRDVRDNAHRFVWNTQLILKKTTMWLIRIWDLRVIKIILFTSNIQVIWDKKFRLETTFSQNSSWEYFGNL